MGIDTAQSATAKFFLQPQGAGRRHIDAADNTPVVARAVLSGFNVDSQRVVEALDQSARLDSERTMAVGRGSRHGACLGKHGRIDSGWQ